MVQVNNSKITVRIKFKKLGKLQYISHLDMVRTMNKIIVRAKLPLYYTEGFNPKPKMTFAAQPSIGMESHCEFMNLRLTEKIDPKIVMDSINSNVTDEMRVVDAYYPEADFSELKWFSYTILIKTASADKALAELCENILHCEKLEVLKKTKSGEAMVDVAPLIRSASAALDGDLIRISCVLSGDSNCFLNPEYLIKLLRERAGILSDPNLTNEYYSITREKAHKSDMSEFF